MADWRSRNRAGHSSPYFTPNRFFNRSTVWSHFAAVGLLVDLALRRRLFQFRDARVGDLGADDRKLLQIRKPAEMRQSRVGDQVVEKEPCQVCESLAVRCDRTYAAEGY